MLTFIIFFVIALHLKFFRFFLFLCCGIFLLLVSIDYTQVKMEHWVYHHIHLCRFLETCHVALEMEFCPTFLFIFPQTFFFSMLNPHYQCSFAPRGVVLCKNISCIL